MKKILTNRIHVLETLIALFITTLIVSNIVSIKLITVGPLVFDAGTLLFPLAYIIGDIIAEVYGFKKMRQILLLGVAALLITSLTFWLVGILPASSDWGNQAAYDSILGVVWRIVTASIIAIFVGELVNAYILAKLKIKTAGKNLWYRLIGSSAIGNAVDTTLFTVIAFAGLVPVAVVWNIIWTVFLIKMTIEIIISPFTMKIIAAIKRQENIDVFEEPAVV